MLHILCSAVGSPSAQKGRGQQIIQEVLGKFLDNKIPLLYERLLLCAQLDLELEEEVVCLRWIAQMAKMFREKLDLTAAKSYAEKEKLKSGDGVTQSSLLHLAGQISVLQQG